MDRVVEIRFSGMLQIVTCALTITSGYEDVSGNQTKTGLDLSSKRQVLNF